MLIGLSGYAGSGKDTAADFLVEKGFKKRGFADLLRAAVAALDPIVAVEGGYPVRYSDAVEAYGYNEAKARYPEVRQVLQRMGTEVARDLLGSNIWVDNTITRILLDSSSRYWVITDVRFANEASAIAAEGGLLVRIERPGVQAVNDHPSEHLLDDYNFDHRIENDGTPEQLGAKLFEYVQDKVDYFGRI